MKYPRPLPEPPEESALSPRLREALAAVDPAVAVSMAEAVLLHRDFPAWAVWVPGPGQEWSAARPASHRPPGPSLPLLWVSAPSAPELADRMVDTDIELQRRDF